METTFSKILGQEEGEEIGPEVQLREMRVVEQDFQSGGRKIMELVIQPGERRGLGSQVRREQRIRESSQEGKEEIGPGVQSEERRGVRQ
jgi:hypothetical protein